MEITKTCKECGLSRCDGYKCDNCSKGMFYHTIAVTFGYGHSLDGEEYHFCSDECIYSFFEQEIKKEE